MPELKYCLYYLDRKKTLRPGDSLTLGREAGSEILLPEETVSRKHARVYWEDGHFVIEDTRSLNGLRVNGARCDRHVLYDGDHIVIGSFALVFREFNPEDDAEIEMERQISDTLCIEQQMAELLKSISDSRIRSKLFSLKHSVDRAREKLDLLANRDRLTQLYARRYFDVELEKEIERASRYGHGLSLLIIDIDHFKVVNDTYGHRRGDKVLAGIAAIIMAHTRRNDLAARYGGEEIAVVIPQLSTRQAVAAAEKIRGLIERETPARTGLPVTISIGIALFAAGDTSATLVGKADKALYKAKELGRNRVIVYAQNGEAT
jgi:diguanylate cyclase (GGDEF)-like protein